MLNEVEKCETESTASVFGSGEVYKRSGNVVYNFNYLVSEKRLVKSDHRSKTASHHEVISFFKGELVFEIIQYNNICVANGGSDMRSLFVQLPNFDMLVRCYTPGEVKQVN